MMRLSRDDIAKQCFKLTRNLIKEKVVESSLPENLILNTDDCIRIMAKQLISANTVWGPYDVDKTSVDGNQSQSLSGIRILNGEWIAFLLEKRKNKMTTMGDDEESNTTITFYKKDFQISVSANEDIDNGVELNCNLVVTDQQFQVDLSGDNDQNNEKLSKTCKYCGINFSHQCTLDAHMTYYCSKRQNILNESNLSPKCQKTWRTRQRNKQPNIQKSNEVPAFSANLFGEEGHLFKGAERNIPPKLLIIPMNTSESQLNLNSTPIISHATSLNKKSLAQPTLVTNGNSHSHSLPNVKQVESEKLCNSDSEPETGTANTLGFCAPCGLFFSSKELYNIHMQLDMSNLQSSIAKCNSLVLAAPVFNNNGIQYVPIHPRNAVINCGGNVAQHTKINATEDHAPSSIPLDLSINNNSKSPTHLQQINAVNRIAAAAAAAASISASNCNHILRSNKRPFLCQHCQTRFQLYSTFQAHQEFYCQGKRQHQETPEKRCRTASNNSGTNDNETLMAKNDDVNWKVCNQGFKCEGCGFIGQTKRGIRIHCKNQCFKRFSNQKSDSKYEDPEINSPTSEVWGGSTNATVAMESPEHSEFCHDDSPIKIESV